MFVATLLIFLQSTIPNTPAYSSTHTIPRFQMLADGVYRGGQPGREGFEYLKKTGIKTVINLRVENDEEGVVRELGMNYVHIPINLKLWSTIPEKAVAHYFRVINNPENYPIFFHCKRGADRTGALAGFYRITFQGWEPRNAYSEARSIGMRWWYQALKQQLYSFKKPNLALIKTVEAAQ
jgi:tyrosine-protein phosphatase SIW14